MFSLFNTVCLRLAMRLHMLSPKPFVTNLSPVYEFPYTLPSSVSSKSFICHSYENNRGGGVLFPVWNRASEKDASPEGASRLRDLSSQRLHIPFVLILLRTLLRILKSQPFSFQQLMNSFAKTPGVGVG